ncbi:GntR family transcriptional regulator [Erysipelothrix aquatica]|uniref:GntR family transcriptional regulator n=1 Tax=Erysipelothrix aquatica TaxID=2683714 RepID=UPI0013567C18|nr:GntR family transcriptional regulator [Erysipelothrix aquatica]
MIDKTNNIPIFRQIYTNLIMEMQEGRFKKGDLLPGTRSLALDLNVSRNSVERAYMQLEIEGYILSKPNLGFVVFDTFSEIKLEAVPNLRKPQTESSDSIIDFKYGGNGFSTFPKAKWKQHTSEVLSSETDPFLDNKGNINLRIAISEYLYRHWGVRASYEQIIVTNGYVYSLEIVSNILKARNSKSTITMEDPGFPVTRNTLIKMECLTNLLSIVTEI